MFFQVLPEAVFQPVERGNGHRQGPCPKDLPFRGTLHPLFFPVEATQARKNNYCTLQDVWNQRQRMCPTRNCQKQQKMEKTVAAKLDFHEFSPEEIKVKVVDNAIVVHGRHQDESSFFEVRRSVPLSKELSSPDIVCRYVDGHVIVELPPQTVRSKVIADRVDKKKEKARKQEECEVSEEERKSFEKFMKNLTNLQEMFFGYPFFGQCEQNESAEKTDGEKKEEKTKTSAKNEDGDGETEGKVNTERSEGDVDAVREAKAVAHDNCEKADDKRERADDESESEEQIESEITENADFHVDTECSDIESETNEEPEQTVTYAVVPAVPDFKVELDISKFEPDDIRVVVSDRQVMVSGEREIKGDNYSEVEKWSRRINLPDGVDESKLSSVVDKDGKMIIQAPYRKDKGETSQNIHIEMAD